MSLALKPESPVGKLTGLFSGSSEKISPAFGGFAFSIPVNCDRGLAMKIIFGRCRTGARQGGRRSIITVSGLLNFPILPASVENIGIRPGISAC
jgi:hypothetical protein